MKSKPPFKKGTMEGNDIREKKMIVLNVRTTGKKQE